MGEKISTCIKMFIFPTRTYFKRGRDYPFRREMEEGWGFLVRALLAYFIYYNNLMFEFNFKIWAI